MDSVAIIWEFLVSSLFQISAHLSVDLSNAKLPFSVNQRKSTKALWHVFHPLWRVVLCIYVDTCLPVADFVSKYMKRWTVKIIFILTYARSFHTDSLTVCMLYTKCIKKSHLNFKWIKYTTLLSNKWLSSVPLMLY